MLTTTYDLSVEDVLEELDRMAEAPESTVTESVQKMKAWLQRLQLQRYEDVITDLAMQKSRLCRELARALQPPHLTDSPTVIKRKLELIGLEMISAIAAAHEFAASHDWLLKGGFVDGEYKFEVSDAHKS
jgi:hypothetical protein